MKKKLMALVTAAIMTITSVISALPTSAATTELTSTEKKALDAAICDGLDKMSAEIDISTLNISKTKKDSVKDYFLNMLYENGQYFYVVNKIQYTYFPSKDPLLTLKFTYTDNSATVKSMQKEFNAAVEKALSIIEDGMTAAQKALAFYDYLALNCEYNSKFYDKGTETPYMRTAYAALVQECAVCEGYTKAYMYLLKQVGVSTKWVSSDKMNHAWCKVKIGSTWYNVDVTWADTVVKANATTKNDDYDWAGYVDHKYFLCSDAQFESAAYGYKGAESDAPASLKTTYDKAWFKSIKSGMYYVDGVWYYRSGSNVYSRKFSGADKTVVVKTGKFSTTDTSAYKYYSRLAVYDGYLYYNTSTKLIRYNLDGTGKKTLTNVSATGGFIYEMKLSDGKLYYGVKYGDSYKTKYKTL